MKPLNTKQPERLIRSMWKVCRANRWTLSDLVRLAFALIASYADKTGVVSPYIVRKARKNLNTILDGERVVRGRPVKRK